MIINKNKLSIQKQVIQSFLENSLSIIKLKIRSNNKNKRNNNVFKIQFLLQINLYKI